MKYFSLLILTLSIVARGEYVNTNVRVNVDSSSHLTKVIYSITVNCVKSSSIYNFQLPRSYSDRVAYLGAVFGQKVDTENGLDVKRIERTDKSIYEISLGKTIMKDESFKMVIELILTELNDPLPQQIEQGEKQYMKLKFLLNFHSPYLTEKSKTIVELANDKILSFTKHPSNHKQGKKVTYGVYENVAALDEKQIEIHYENNSPFIVIDKMEREIELSHWGAINIREEIYIRHYGADMKGSFSRLDYQRQSQQTNPSVAQFTSILPATAKNIYYRDIIGNISTSNVRDHFDHQEIEIQPRFPLMGGWKTDYMIGYNLPSHEYLYNKDDQYVLQCRIVEQIMNEQLIKNLKVKIILPEYVGDVRLVTPYEVKREKDENVKTYLDTVGRPVIVFTAKNLVFHHIQDLQVQYKFEKLYLLKEPLLMMFVIFVTLAFFILLIRMDMTIETNKESDSRLKAKSLLDVLLKKWDERFELYSELQDAINSFAFSKDSFTFAEKKRKNDAAFKNGGVQINQVIWDIRQNDQEIGMKVKELEKMEEKLKSMHGKLVSKAEAVASGKGVMKNYRQIEETSIQMYMEVRGQMRTSLMNLY
ncbi:hypothetical protein SNEBB_004424 [Seison nebaliae]|nr:hypothetical protein SNEBB_004424 [Seison nebaliae]